MRDPVQRNRGVDGLAFAAEEGGGLFHGEDLGHGPRLTVEAGSD